MPRYSQNRGRKPPYIYFQPAFMSTEAMWRLYLDPYACKAVGFVPGEPFWKVTTIPKDAKKTTLLLTLDPSYSIARGGLGKGRVFRPDPRGGIYISAPWFSGDVLHRISVRKGWMEIRLASEKTKGRFAEASPKTGDSTQEEEE